MEEKLDLELFEKHKETLKPYLQSVISKGVVCVAPHLKHVRDKDPVAVLCAELMERFGLSLREMCYLFVTKDLKDLHIYCEICGHRRPKLIDDKKYCSTKCMYKSEDYQQTVKAARAAQKKEFDGFKKSLVAGLVKETKDFSFYEAKARIDELRAYMSTLAKADGCVNISPHRKALTDKNSTAIFVEQMMYRYDLTLEEVNFLVKCDFTKSLFCKTCGCRLENVSLDHCSTSCARRDPEVQAKYEETSRQNYGVSNPAQSRDVKNKIKDTCQEKYGVDYAFQAEEVKESIQKTSLERYGVTSPAKAPEVIEKMKATNQERYGVDYTWQADEIKSKITEKNTLLRRQRKYPLLLKLLKLKSIEMLSTYEEYLKDEVLRFKCLNCGYEFSAPYSTYIQYRIICENCYKNSRSTCEGELFHFIRDLLPDVEIIRNSRTLLEGKEIDLYVPSKNIAFEYDGAYWHSSNMRNVDPMYHWDKTEKAAEKGVSLMHIFDTEWMNKKEIVKSAIRSRLGIYNRKIYARDCEVKLIEVQPYREFLEENHIQGYANAIIRLGLFYNDELVACIGISKSRFKKGEVELVRYCTKMGVIVIGGFSRLVIHSRVKEMVSYVDRRYFDGLGYEKAGFELIGKSRPGYVYVKGSEILSRYQCQKHLLPELLGDKFDPDLTEVENMTNRGYYQVFDCGMLKFRYIRKEESTESK